MIKLCGLWASETKDGRVYYSGRMNEAKLLIFPVRDEGDNKPAFDAYIGEWKKEIKDGTNS